MKIQLAGVSKKFGSVAALKEVSLDLEAGQIVAVLGLNGAGKSTLLRCLAGIVAAQQGHVLYDGQKFERGRLDLRKKLFFLPDFPVMYFHQSTLRHIAMVLHLYGADGDGVEKRVLELLEEFDLLPFCDTKTSIASPPFPCCWKSSTYCRFVTGLWANFRAVNFTKRG